MPALHIEKFFYVRVITALPSDVLWCLSQALHKESSRRSAGTLVHSARPNSRFAKRSH